MVEDFGFRGLRQMTANIGWSGHRLQILGYQVSMSGLMSHVNEIAVLYP